MLAQPKGRPSFPNWQLIFSFLIGKSYCNQKTVEIQNGICTVYSSSLTPQGLLCAVLCSSCWGYRDEQNNLRPLYSRTDNKEEK